MSNDDFLIALQDEVRHWAEEYVTDQEDWIVKGFIDVYSRIYAVPGDTKVVSKLLEVLLIPKLSQFGEKQGYTVTFAAQQNFYPDISFISKSRPDQRYAVDIKTTYRVDQNTVNGMTLGAFTGYFRDRTSSKNTTFAYAAYKAHLVLGVIYSRRDTSATEAAKDGIDLGDATTYTLEQLHQIKSVIHDLRFFVQPKYRIASARPGSGNTRNIGSLTKIDQLLNGTGPFAALGEEIYDDYWMNYLNADMARKIESKPPYNNLETYALYRQQVAAISPVEAKKLDTADTGAARPDGEVSE